MVSGLIEAVSPRPAHGASEIAEGAARNPSPYSSAVGKCALLCTINIGYFKV